MPLSPVDLYKKFAGTDAKALASIHALAALNIHFGGSKYISPTTIGEYLQNLTYQALSQENNKIFMSFDNIGLLVNDLLEQFVGEENNEIDKASAMSEKINNKLKRSFQSVLSSKMKIQKGEEDKEVETTPKPIDVSTPLKRLEEFNETEKETFLQLTINQTDLKTVTDAVDADSEALLKEIVNTTSGYIIDDKINVDTQFDFQNRNLDTSFKLSNTLKNKLDNLLKKARLKVSNLQFPGEASVDIPNDVLYFDNKIATEDIYIDDGLRDILYPNEPIYFPQSSTDDRKDFEVNVKGDDLIIFKSPTLNYVGVAKEEFKGFFDKIIKDLDLSLKEKLMSEEDKIRKID